MHKIGYENNNKNCNSIRKNYCTMKRKQLPISKVKIFVRNTRPCELANKFG